MTEDSDVIKNQTELASARREVLRYSPEEKVKSLRRRAFGYLQSRGVQPPSDIRVEFSKEKELVASAASLTSNDYKRTWTALVVSELKNRYGLEISQSVLLSTLAPAIKEVTAEDFGSADILLSSRVLSQQLLESDFMHELWHVIVHKSKKSSDTPLLVEGEAHYVATNYSPIRGYEHRKGSFDWYKYDAPAEIIARVMKGRTLRDILHDDYLRKRLNAEIEEFYRDPARTPGYVMIPYVKELLNTYAEGEADITTKEGVAQTYEKIGQPALAEAVRKAELADSLIKDLRIACAVPLF